MVDFVFTSPEGKDYTVSGPEGATKQDAFAILQKKLGAAKEAGINPMIPGVEPGLNPQDSTLQRTLGQGIPIAGGFIPDTPGTKAFQKDYPISHAITKGVGSALATAPAMLAAPGAFGLSAGASLLRNTLTGMATGGGIGLADAAARGEPLIQGSATGALEGVALPVGGKMVGGTFQGILNLFGPGAPGILKGVNKKALEVASDIAKGNGLTDVQIAGMLKEKGSEAFLADFHPDFMSAARQVAGHRAGSGTGKEAMVNAFEDRVAPEAQHNRLKSGLDTLFGKSPVNLTQEKLQGIADRKAASDPAFARFNQTRIQPTPEIKAITEDFEGLGLLSDAKRIAKEHSAGGTPIAPMENFFTTGQRKDWPTAQSWQHVKEAIDKKIRASYTPEGNPTVDTRNYLGMKARLDKAIADHPDKSIAQIWTDAREAWGTPTGIMHARELGEKTWRDAYRPDQLIQDLTNFSQAERDAFKEGAQAALEHRLGRAGRADKNTSNFLLGPNQAEKLRYLTENKTTDTKAFIKSLEHEKGYEEGRKGLGESSQNMADERMSKKLTANPEDLLISKVGEQYTPLHVRPFQAAAEMTKGPFIRRQNRQFEDMRDALAKLLIKQGPEAQEIAKALLRYAPLKGHQAGMTTTGLVQALARPSEPKLPIPYLSPQLGGTQ